MDGLFHFIMPVAILLGLKFNKKWVLYLSPLAILPDLDHFLFKPRATLHNIFFLCAALLVIFILFRKDKSKLFIAGFFILSHILLDFEGVAFFYPVSEEYLGIEAYVKINKKTFEIIPYIGLRKGSYVELGGSEESGYLATLEAIKVFSILIIGLSLFNLGRRVVKLRNNKKHTKKYKIEKGK